jgi:hypothetical protein
MTRLKLFCLLSVALLSSPARSQSACDAQTLSLLKTEYTRIRSGTVAEALYEASCENTSNQRDTNFGLNIPAYGELSFAENAKSVREACYSKDHDFFFQYSGKLGFCSNAA